MHSLMMMSLRKRIFLGLMTVTSVLCIYILCFNLGGALTWSVVPPRYFQNKSSPRFQESEELQDQKNLTFPPKLPSASVLRQTPKPSTPIERQEPAESSKVLNVSKSTAVPHHPRTTEPAYVGDKYITEHNSRQTNCPEGIQGHVSETDFAKQFMKYLPVLLWSKHVSPEQYQRLSRYPGTYGWAGLDYDMLQDTLSSLNSSVNQQMFDDWNDRSNSSRCVRCAVVGNGGILKNSSRGKEIDDHHYVFRTNGAIIKGFEEDIGSRTTHYTFSTNTMMNSMWNYKGAGFNGPPISTETRYVFLPDHDRDYLLLKAAAMRVPVARGRDNGRNPTALFGKDVSAKKLKMYNPDFVRYLRNRFLSKNKPSNIYRPSTGAVMLLAALHTCDQVSAYGFMTPDYKNYSDHYYDKKYHSVVFYANHDLRMELALWQQLHRAGLIRLYQRDDKNGK